MTQIIRRLTMDRWLAVGLVFVFGAQLMLSGDVHGIELDGPYVCKVLER